MNVVNNEFSLSYLRYELTDKKQNITKNDQFCFFS